MRMNCVCEPVRYNFHVHNAKRIIIRSRGFYGSLAQERLRNAHCCHFELSKPSPCSQLDLQVTLRSEAECVIL